MTGQQTIDRSNSFGVMRSILGECMGPARDPCFGMIDVNSELLRCFFNGMVHQISITEVIDRESVAPE